MKWTTVLLALLITACAHHPRQTWTGQSYEVLVDKLGAPQREIDLPNGRKELTWTFVRGYRGETWTCLWSATIDKNGIIEKWFYRGC